jgi:hypothetical protein
MSDEIVVEGNEYISSKRASQLSGYAQDYIGQLARSGQIEAKRIGGLWYVSMESLESYKNVADAYKPQPPPYKDVSGPETLINFDGKDYISAARASEVTGYHQDYVGQLARSEAIPARQVGNRWYVARDEILAHKAQKDALLGAVQSESVGIQKSRKDPIQTEEQGEASIMTYSPSHGDLIPKLGDIDGSSPNYAEDNFEEREEINTIPIHVVKPRLVEKTATQRLILLPRRSRRVKTYFVVSTTLIFTVILLISFVYFTARSGSFTETLTTTSKIIHLGERALGSFGTGFEEFLVPEIVYKRGA